MLTFLRLLFDTLLFSEILAKYSYTTRYIEVPVDHFSFTTNTTFRLRYLYNAVYWDEGGPIFFYPGNEGSVDLFVQGTGFLWEIAPRFGALIVFAEHRYYGESLPFGELSLLSLQYLGYLTSAQALADYVLLLDRLQQDSRFPCPVITFGGSYGGILATWMRFKYPSVVYGAIASSAPIWQFEGLVPCNAFNEIVTRVYKDCSVIIKDTWRVLRKIAQEEDGREWLTEVFRLCEPLEIESFIDWLAGIYGDIAMVNYPYEADFLKPMPANPVDVVCEILLDSGVTDVELVFAVARAISVYTNYTGSVRCNDLNGNDSKLGEQGWDFQACTEMVMPMCSTSAEMFEEKQWDFDQFSDACFEKWGTRPNAQLPILEYGGRNLDGYSNVVFSNGLQDPWSAGSVLEDYSDTLLAFVMPNAAHHLDFRASHPKDSTSVKRVRLFHQRIIWKWLKEYYGKQ